MNKKFIMVFLTILSFGVSIYLSASNITFDEERYGATGVMLFSIPITLVLVNSNLFFLPIKKYGSYARIKNGLESIFLSLSIILFLLHCGILLSATRAEINLLLFIPLSVGIVLITTANTLPRFQLELDKNSSHSNLVWNNVIRPFSLPMYTGGLAMLFCVFLPGNFMMISFFTILLLTVLISLYCSYKAYQTSING